MCDAKHTSVEAVIKREERFSVGNLEEENVISNSQECGVVVKGLDELVSGGCRGRPGMYARQTFLCYSRSDILFPHDTIPFQVNWMGTPHLFTYLLFFRPQVVCGNDNPAK